VYNQQQEPHDAIASFRHVVPFFLTVAFPMVVCSVSNPKCSLLRRSRLLTLLGSRYGGVCAAWDSVSSRFED
jgi:hypothetical protein